MNQKSPKSERMTAIVSTLVAVAILAAGVTAQQSHQAPQDELARLESDLRFQIERAYKHDGSRRDLGMVQVDQVFHAWQTSPQSSVDRTLLVAWLTEATINSMPGAKQSLPAVPKFGLVQKAPVAAAEFAEATPAPANSTSSDTTLIFTVDQSDNIASVSLNRETKLLTQQTPVEVAVLTTTDSNSIVAASTQVAVSRDKKQSNPTVQINLTELTARITGYHHGLDAVETELLMLSTPNLNIIAKQIHQLDEMTKDFHFVELYYESLTDKERRLITPPRSMEATLAEILRQLRRFEEAQNDDFLSEFDSAQNEQISSLRNQIATIAERVAP